MGTTMFGGTDFSAWRPCGRTVFAGTPKRIPAVQRRSRQPPSSLERGSLRVSADVEQNGCVKVSVFDERNELLAQSEPLKGSLSDEKVVWRVGFSFDEFGEKKIQIQFEFQLATIYSFSLVEP